MIYPGILANGSISPSTTAGVIRTSLGLSVTDSPTFSSLLVSNNVTVSNILLAGSLVSTSSLSLTGFIAMVGTASGRLLLSNSGLTNFDMLQFGGTSASFPALKRSATALHIRLANDSAFAPLSCGAITTDGHLLALIDNAYDLGALGASRLRSIYVATSVFCAALRLDAGGSNGLFTDSGFPNIRDFNGLRRMSFGDSTATTPIRAMTRMCIGATNYFTGGGVSMLDIVAESAAMPGLIVQGAASQTGILVQLRGQSSTTARQRADWDSEIIDNTDATRKYRSVHRAWDTASREYMRGWGDGSVGRIACAAPASAPTDSHLAASQLSFYLDEGAHNLLVRVKYADGTTLKLATIALA